MANSIEDYKGIVSYLRNVLPYNYEIVLQDVKAKKIVAIANSEVSGRHINSPLTDFALKIIADEEWKKKDCELNYTGKTQDGKILRSSTYFIKNEDELIGMLCINVNMSVYHKISEEFLSISGVSSLSPLLSFDYSNSSTPSDKPIENFSKSRDDVIDSTIDSCLESMGNTPVSRLTQSEKLEIVKLLSDKGVFLLKGAISDTAKKLSCSEASIYRYLSKISKN